MTMPPYDLTEALYTLASAQARSEEKLAALAEAQGAMTRVLTQNQRLLGELVRAQTSLSKVLEHLAKEVGGIGDTIGVSLENAALKGLPAVLEADQRVKVHGKLERSWKKNKAGRSVQLDIFGRGFKDGKEVVIVGETKSRLSVRDVSAFIKNRIEAFEGIFEEEILPILATRNTTSDRVVRFAEARNIAIYYSYEF